MGIVYQAQDRLLQRTVAVKVFRDGTAEMARTSSETQLLAGLNHPSLVTLFDAHIGGDAPRYLVMEYVDGPTLGERLARGPLALTTVAGIARDLGDALHTVHQSGIVHRDIKPSNVLLRASTVPGEEFRAKLADFGIAYLIDSTRLTTPGAVIGSAAYLSPEQVTGAAPAPAADIYALGLLLLESLTGHRAFAQAAMHEAVVARLSQDPVVPASVGHDWGALLTAMTARDPERRPTALDVVAAAGAIRVGTASEQDTVDAPAPAVHEDRRRSAMTSRVGPSPSPTGLMNEPSLRTTLELEASPPDSEVADAVRPRPPRRWMIAVVTALIAVAIALAVVLGASLARDTGGAPELPALPVLDEPINAHLQDLLQAVSP